MIVTELSPFKIEAFFVTMALTDPDKLRQGNVMNLIFTELLQPKISSGFSEFDQALEFANDSELGLGANIYTKDLEETFRAVNEIETGIVWVNTPLNDNDAIPFGGRKFTGSGRELGAEGLELFRNSKMVMIAPVAEADPEWFPYPDDDTFGAINT